MIPIGGVTVVTKGVPAKHTLIHLSDHHGTVMIAMYELRIEAIAF